MRACKGVCVRASVSMREDALVCVCMCASVGVSLSRWF